jgi:hypothetical protein
MIKDRLAKIREAAEKATQGEWLIGDWGIFDSDREAQKRREPFWTLINGDNGIVKGPFGRKSNNPEYIIRAVGYDECGLEISTEDTEYITLANPSTMLQLLDYISDLEKCVGVQKKGLEYYKDCDQYLSEASFGGKRVIQCIDGIDGIAIEALTTVEGIMEKYNE